MRQAFRCCDSGVPSNALTLCCTKAPAPTGLPEEVSTYSHMVKRRNLWGKSGRKRPFPPTGSRLWDRKNDVAITRVPAIDRQNTSAAKNADTSGFTHSSSKSSLSERAWFFALVLPRPWTSFFQSSVDAPRHIQPVDCAQRKRAKVRFAAQRSPNFSTFGNQPTRNAVPPGREERSGRLPGSKHPVLRRPHTAAAPG